MHLKSNHIKVPHFCDSDKIEYSTHGLFDSHTSIILFASWTLPSFRIKNLLFYVEPTLLIQIAPFPSSYLF